MAAVGRDSWDVLPWYGTRSRGHDHREVTDARNMMLLRPSPPSEDERWRTVQERMRQLGHRPDALIEVLHAAQEAFG